MRISKHRIHNVENYLAAVPDGGSFRVTVHVSSDLLPRLAKAGFPRAPESGMTIMPAIVGPISRFNADGGWQVHRDRPKESRYIRTVWWTWLQWAGRDQVEEHEDSRDIFRDCYQRDRIEPPSAELTYQQHEGHGYVVSEILRKNNANLQRAKHVINLFLEMFGICEVLDLDLTQFPDPTIRKVNWRMLPPGEYPWQRLEQHVREYHGSRSAGDLLVIEERQQTIKGHKPDLLYVGEGGFADYIAYVFKDRGIVIMESIRRDNAIYIFGKNWAQASKLTKAEVLSNQHHLARIIHAKGWKERLSELLKTTKVA